MRRYLVNLTGSTGPDCLRSKGFCPGERPKTLNAECNINDWRMAVDAVQLLREGLSATCRGIF